MKKSESENKLSYKRPFQNRLMIIRVIMYIRARARVCVWCVIDIYEAASRAQKH